MNDDIVTRLRVPLPWMLEGVTTKQLGEERQKAADLIEELLLSNNRWQSIAERAMEQLDIAMNLINTLQGVNNG